MKAQASVEAILVIGISTALLIPASVLFYEFLVASNQDIQENHIIRIGHSFVENSNLVYQYGNRAKIVVDYKFPDNIYNMSIEKNNTLLILFTGPEKMEVYPFYFNHNVSASFNVTDWQSGVKSFEFKTIRQGDAVSIKRV